MHTLPIKPLSPEPLQELRDMPTQQQRRRSVNLGFINPTLGSNLDIGDINDAASARQQAINNAAADSYEKWRQAQIDNSAQTTAQNQQDLVNAKTVQALSAQTGFGLSAPQKDIWNPSTQQYERPGAIPVKDQYDPSTGRYIRVAQPGYRSANPTPQQLQSNFQELSTPQQAQIAQSGQAPFVDPATTAKLVQGLQESREKSITTGINNLTDGLSKGEIQFNPDDRKFYRYQLDPENPESGLKKKVPLGPYENYWMQEGMKRGMIPDIDQFSKTPARNAAPSDLQGIAQDLGQPANSSIPQVQAALASTKIPYPMQDVGDSSNTMALTPTGPMPSNMQLGTNYAYQGTMGIPYNPDAQTPVMQRTGSQDSFLPVASRSYPTPGLDSATAAGAQAATTVSKLGSQISSGISQIGDNAPNDLANFGRMLWNAPGAAANTVARFVSGATGSNLGQYSQLPYTPPPDPNAQPLPGQEAQDAQLRAAMAAMKAKYNQPDDSSLASE